MRSAVVAAAIVMAALLPETGNAQVYLLPTPPPAVTAANEAWQHEGEPIFYEGSYYYPAGPTVYFDGNVMKRTGVWRGVPLYSDATLEPFSVVYVPVGGNVMRPYERLRNGELTGTVGSRMPSFPIDRDVELSAMTGYTGLQFPPLPPVGPRSIPEYPYVPPSAGVPPPAALSSMAPAPAAAQPTHMQSIPPPQGNIGVWIEYEGTRWTAARAVVFTPEQFVRVGEYHSFPVYRLRSGGNDIYIPVVEGGMVTRYAR